MATIFVSAVDGNNTDNGTTWALAKQTVAGALAIAAAGDIIYVDNAGTFTANAAISWAPPAAGGGIFIASVARSGTTGAVLSAGAIESVGAANAAFTISNVVGSSMYVFGMTIKGGTNTNAACIVNMATASASSFLKLDTCTIDLPSASAVNVILGAPNSSAPSFQSIQMKSCVFNCTGSRTGTYFSIQNAKTEIISPTFAFTGGSKPAEIITATNASSAGSILMRDGDASGFSGTAYVLLTNISNSSVYLVNLKLNATPTITAGSFPSGSGGAITVRNCDSADTTYVFSYYNAYGTLTVSTSIYLNGTTAEFDGSPVSWKIVTTSACSQYFPFVLPPVRIWDTTTTAQTSAIEFAQDSSATALTDQEIWSDLDSPASSSFPNYTWQSNRNASPIVGTPADQTSSSATWTGLTTPTTQKLNNTFTAAVSGLLSSVISVGKASTTLYINPWLDGVT